MMPPLIPAVQHGFGHYAELRLTGTDVLIVGDSLTLRAGSDLHFLLQGAGGGDWAGAAEALAGWRSRAEMRWVRPTTIGEFSLRAVSTVKASNSAAGRSRHAGWYGSDGYPGADARPWCAHPEEPV
jgi:hypothetical protein